MKYTLLDKHGKEVTKNLSRGKAIKEQCLNCSAYSPLERTRCPIIDCPLHPYRTGEKFPGWSSIARAQAIRTYCLERCSLGQQVEVRLCPNRFCSLFPFRRCKTDRTFAVITPEEPAAVEETIEATITEEAIIK